MKHLNEDDVLRIIRENSEESTEVEFKELLNLKTHTDKLEFAKDISAMANALGGTILYGVTKKGIVIGIDPKTFDLQKMHDIINNRAVHYIDFNGQLIEMLNTAPNVKVGVIIVEKNTNPPVCVWSSDHTRLIAYRRQGNTIKELNADEIKNLSKEGILRLPSWHRINLKETGVFNYDFSKRESSFEWFMAPEQDRIWGPVLPVPMPYIPFTDGIGVMTNCGGTGGRWLEILREIEVQIDKNHGIVAECWTIRNNRLLGPLPESMQYFTGPSVECLSDKLNDKRIDKYGYLSCVFLAYPNLLYVFQGQMNNLMALNVYSSSIPARPLIIKIEDQKAVLNESSLSFITLEAKRINVVEWSGIPSIVDQSTQNAVQTLSEVEILGYIGQRTESPFKIKGLYILKANSEIINAIKEKDGEEGTFLAKSKPPILFCHLLSRRSEDDKKNVELTTLNLTLRRLNSILSTTLIITAECGIF